MRLISLAAAFCLVALPSSAGAQEVFAGVYVHEVDTPFTLHTDERGADIVVGYRFDRIDAWELIGSPAPYIIASLNTAGDTSFAGAGLSWTIDNRRIYLRPAIGLVLHDGPGRRLDQGRRTELGSRVLFEPEIAVGYRLDDRLSVEASWVHISHARLFNRQQNPGIDMIGARLNLRL